MTAPTCPACGAEATPVPDPVGREMPARWRWWRCRPAGHLVRWSASLGRWAAWP